MNAKPDYQMTWEDRRDLFQDITLKLSDDGNDWITFETHGTHAWPMLFFYQDREMEFTPDISREQIEKLHRWTGAMLKFWDVTFRDYEELGPKMADGSDVVERDRQRAASTVIMGGMRVQMTWESNDPEDKPC